MRSCIGFVIELLIQRSTLHEIYIEVSLTRRLVVGMSKRLGACVWLCCTVRVRVGATNCFTGGIEVPIWKLVNYMGLLTVR